MISYRVTIENVYCLLNICPMDDLEVEELMIWNEYQLWAEINCKNYFKIL